MFKCQACKGTSAPGEQSRSYIANKRDRYYELLDKYGKRIGVRAGWEIEKEVKLCSACYEGIREQDE
jgi:hypothetical protein